MTEWKKPRTPGAPDDAHSRTTATPEQVYRAWADPGFSRWPGERFALGGQMPGRRRGRC